MRITLLISAMTSGGAERVMSIMANYWADKGWQVTLITADDGSAAPFYPLRPGVRHVTLGVLRKSKNPFDSLKNNARYVRSLRREIRRSTPDLVLSFITECNIRALAASIGLKVPVLVSERNDPARYALGTTWRLLRTKLYARAHTVVVQTQDAKAFFPPELQERICVIPNPVPIPEGEHGIACHSKGKPTVISVGRLVPQKGFDLLLTAFAAISTKYPAWQLKIVGDGPLRAELEARGRALGIADRVELRMPTKELARELRAADLFVSASRWEGFPNALCEAMALGIPVVATSCSAGPKEIVRHGENGLLIPVDNAQALGFALDTLMGDDTLRQRLGAAAQEVSTRFSVERIMERWEALFPSADSGISAAAPKKVCHVATVATSLKGLLLNQMKSLQEAGYEVVTISSAGPETAALEEAGIRHIPVEMTRRLTPFADLKSLWQLYRVMKRERLTIVHTHTPKPSLLGQIAARLAGVPVVVNTVHGFYFHDYMKPYARAFYVFLEKIAARCSDSILSQNKEDMETAIIERICVPSRISHLGNGIDLDRFNPGVCNEEEVAQLRRKLELPESVKVVGFVGRLTARKGFFDFLSAAAMIAGKRQDVRFLILGPKDEARSDAIDPGEMARYGIQDYCIYVGEQPNHTLPLYYRLMDVLVLPSPFEGIPRAVMEASAMGVPAVVSNVKGNREAVVQGVNGLLFPFGNVPELTNAILAVLADETLAAQLAAGGIARAKTAFDERLVFVRVRDEYERLLREILGIEMQSEDQPIAAIRAASSSR